MNVHNIRSVKEANKKLILNTIIQYGPISNEDIVYKTRLSRPTVINSIKELVEKEIINKSGFSKSYGGRSAELYEIGKKKYFSVGVDFEFPAARIVVSNLMLQTVYYNYWKYEAESSVEEIIETLINKIETAMESVYSNNISYIGIGLGLPGILDLNKGMSLYIERIKGWENIALKEILETRFKVPVYMRNDVHLLARINCKKRLENNIKNFLYLSIRSGIGMAMFINEDLFEGDMGNAGLISHTLININGGICKCGKKGCVETIAGEWAMINEYLQRKPYLNNEKTTFSKLISDFISGDPIAAEIVNNAYYYLGVALSNAIKLIDISHIVINGLPQNCKDTVLDLIKRGVKENSFYNDIERIIVTEDLREEDKALGGALWVIENFLMNLDKYN